MPTLITRFWQPSNNNNAAMVELHTRQHSLHCSRRLVTLPSNTSEKIDQRWRRLFQINFLRSLKLFILILLPIISCIALLIALVFLFYNKKEVSQ